MIGKFSATNYGKIASQPIFIQLKVDIKIAFIWDIGTAFMTFYQSSSQRIKQSSGCVKKICWCFPIEAFFLYLIFQTGTVDMRPTPYFMGNNERWKNPCELPSHLLDPMRILLGGKRNEAVVCKSIIDNTRVAWNQAKTVLNQYVDESFKDSSFIDGTASHRLNWLPKVTREDVKDMTLQEAARFFFSVLQYYGVGLEQVLYDQVLHDGRFFTSFRDTENHMAQLLCELQVSLVNLGVQPNPDVTRDVMKQQYRNVGSHSQRLIRNYLILRDYVDMLEIMVDTFQNIYDRTYATTTPGFTPRIVNH